MIDPKQWFHFAKTVKAEDINTNWQIRNCNLALLEKMHSKFIEITLRNPFGNTNSFSESGTNEKCIMFDPSSDKSVRVSEN